MGRASARALPRRYIEVREEGIGLGAALSRRRRPWLAAPIVGLALLIAAAPATAQRYPPSPQGEDVAFVQLGAVGELVTLELCRAAARSSALDASEAHTFARLAAVQSQGWRRLDSLLGEGAISREAFTVRLPAGVLRSRARTIALAARFERLLAGLYLSGVESAVDPPTRLLLGRHLATSVRNLTVLRRLRGSHLNLRAPRQLSVEYVGDQFDAYLAIPGA